MTSPADDRDERLSEREQAITSARAVLRVEREQTAADKAETARLLAEARAAHREATRERDRARKLGARFVQRVQAERDAFVREIEEREAALAADRERLSTEQTHFQGVRSEFHVNAAAARDRLRDAWLAVKSQQQRAANEWTEANRHFTEQSEALEARSAEVARGEKTLSDTRARIEAETAGLREEAAALEARIENARASLAELEVRRDRARTELLNTEFPAELTIEATDVDDLAARERQLDREKAAVAAIKTSLDQEAADVRDHRRVLNEQLALLSAARGKWQRAERQTVVELEELTRELARREQELDENEQRLIRADVRRRNEAYDLWQLQLRLQAWQSKLTAFEMQWHAERELRESNLERRVARVHHREAEVEDTFRQWEQARSSERERLRAELELWSADRELFARATASLEQERHELLTELTQHAARALAAEQTLGEGKGRDKKRDARRLAVLRRRWERVFDRKSRQIGRLRAEVAAERTKLDDRFQAFHALLVEVVEREAALSNQKAASDLQRAIAQPPETRTANETPRASPGMPNELVVLRAEVERLALVLLDAERPEPVEVPPELLPWAIPEAGKEDEDVLLFHATPRAA